jgi:hypothetical protein
MERRKRIVYKMLETCLQRAPATYAKSWGAFGRSECEGMRMIHLQTKLMILVEAGNGERGVWIAEFVPASGCSHTLESNREAASLTKKHVQSDTARQR